MNRAFTLVDALSLGVIVLLSAVTLVMYPALPAIVPTHFDLRGVANGFMRKEIAAWLTPGIAAASFVLVRGTALLLRGAERERLAASPVDVLAFLVVVLTAEIHVLLLHVWLRGTQSIGGSIAAVLGAFFVALSFVFPRVRRNRLVGIRTPWTLASDENWARTHRFASYAFLGGGLPALLLGISGQAVLAVIPLGAAALLPVLYSYRISRS